MPTTTSHPGLPIRVSIPGPGQSVEQDEERFQVEIDGHRSTLRLHDYEAIFGTPGLYEELVYRTLRCRSPEQITRLLEKALAAESRSMKDLRVLDLGAGNGIVGELLQHRGASAVLGVDILPQAAAAARRDRPEAYDDYVVTDLTQCDAEAGRRMRNFAPNCLVTVAALGFGDVPPEALDRALELLPPDGWIGVCLKERFLEADDDSGFGRLLRHLIAAGTLEVLRRRRHVHRLSTAGEELFYISLIARKRKNRRGVE